MKQLRISACYIVKNEADVLQKSLESIRGQVDDILIVDTGSTDGTQEIAKNAGAHVITYAWKNHFAEARNYALSQLEADWVVFLDADEFFSPETKGNVRREIESAERDGVNLLLVQWKNYDTDTGRHLVDVYTPRIFRLMPSLRYEGRIHEQLRQNGGDVKGVRIVPEKQLTLIHTGYSSHLSKEKAARNLRLLLMDLEESKHPENLYMALAEAYDGTGNDEKAIRYAEMDIQRGRQPITYASRSYRLLLKKLASRPGSFARRKEIAAKAVQDFPELPEFHAEYAECLAQSGLYLKAIAEAKKARQAFHQYQSIEPLQFDEEGERILLQRQRIWEKEIRHDKIDTGADRVVTGVADEALEGIITMGLEKTKKALSANAYDEKALNRYCVLRNDLGSESLAAEIEAFFDKDEQNIKFLLRWSEENGWIRLYLYFAGEMEKRFGLKPFRTDLYRMAESGDWNQVKNGTIAGLAACIPRLVSVLLLLEKEDTATARFLSAQCQTFLPSAAATVWKAYLGENVTYGMDGFNALMPIIFQQGDEEQIARMMALAGGLSTTRLYEVAVQAMNEQHWTAAFDALSRIPSDAPEVTAEFWKNVGICLYRLEEWESSAECFERAVEAGMDTLEIASYRQWIKEKSAS